VSQRGLVQEAHPDHLLGDLQLLHHPLEVAAGGAVADQDQAGFSSLPHQDFQRL
jgi:hypothetical protein